jgi:isoamylase
MLSRFLTNSSTESGREHYLCSTTDACGNRIIDDTLFIVLNAHYESTAFVLPAHRPKVRWELVLDTRGMLDNRRHRPLRGGEVYEMAARSLALFCRRRNHGNHVPREA